MKNRNPMAWDSSPGHYEVWYVTLTDPRSGVGAWVRLTMLAPVDGPAECSLWFLAMDPRSGEVVGRKETWPIGRLMASEHPFALEIAGATLDDSGTKGAFEDVAWDLRWSPGEPAFHVHPLLERARIAKTVLVLPHADVAIEGSLTLPGGRSITLAGARAGQAHLWGVKHAERWAWAHCNDFCDAEDGTPREDTFVDAVSVFVARLGREVGPSTPVVGRFLGDDFAANSLRTVMSNSSRFSPVSWRLEATAGKRRIVVEIAAQREMLAGVVYHDPDGAVAHCYNSEVASMSVSVFDRARTGRFPWLLRETLQSDGRAHFEYAQREPVLGLALHV